MAVKLVRVCQQTAIVTDKLLEIPSTGHTGLGLYSYYTHMYYN